MSKSQKIVKLSAVENFNVDNIIFSDCMDMKIPGSKMGYKRMNISVQHEDGSCGDLIISTTKVYSYGVQKSKDQGTDKVNGYTLPLCLWNKNGASKEEKEFTDLFNNIAEHCKKHLVNVRKEIKNPKLELSDLKKFNPLYWKLDADGNIVEGSGPTLYAKLISTKKNKEEKSDTIKVVTYFSNEDGEEIEPFSLLEKRSYVTAAIKFESIYISGPKMSLQVKVYNAVADPIESGIKSLLVPRKTPARMIPSQTRETLPSALKDDDTGSLPNSDAEDTPQPLLKIEETPEPVLVSTAPKRIVTKVKMPGKK